MSKNITPKSIDSIKRLANQMKRAALAPISHAECLDLAAQKAGYQNFIHALRTMSSGASTAQAAQPVATIPAHIALISAVWRDREAGKGGREELRVQLTIPLSQLLKPQHLKHGRNLAGYWLAAPDHLQHENFLSSQKDAHRYLCGAARTLTFMDVTGLTPSSARRRGYPDGDWDNRPPKCDHHTIWYYGPKKDYVLTDEPYPWNDETGVPEIRQEWAKKHGWSVLRSKWGGMHYPEGCVLYLAADQANGIDLAAIVAKLDALPGAITPATWNGVSIPIASPANRTAA